MAGRKIEHLNQRIHRKLSTILQRETNDPRFETITISSVALARDASFAKVFYSCYPPSPDRAELTAALNRAAGFISRSLARSLQTRTTPQLQFVHDEGFNHAQHLDEVMAELDLADAE